MEYVDQFFVFTAWKGCFVSLPVSEFISPPFLSVLLILSPGVSDAECYGQNHTRINVVTVYDLLFCKCIPR